MLPVFNTVRFFLGLRCVRGSCIVKGPMGSKANWFLFCFPVSGTKDGGSYDLHRYSHFVLSSFFPVTAWPVISARFCFLPSRTECRLWCMCVVTPSSFPSSPWLQTRPSASKSTQLPPHEMPLWAFPFCPACPSCLPFEWCFKARNAGTGEWRWISCVLFPQLGGEAAWDWEILFFSFKNTANY